MSTTFVIKPPKRDPGRSGHNRVYLVAIRHGKIIGRMQIKSDTTPSAVVDFVNRHNNSKAERICKVFQEAKFSGLYAHEIIAADSTLTHKDLTRAWNNRILARAKTGYVYKYWLV
jgi:hypothetical protein